MDEQYHDRLRIERISYYYFQAHYVLLGSATLAILTLWEDFGDTIKLIRSASHSVQTIASFKTTVRGDRTHNISVVSIHLRTAGSVNA